MIPPILYHYCGVDAARGILSDQSIWLTDSRSTNDRSETTHARAFLRRLLPDLIGHETAASLMAFLESTSRHPYIGCFSAKRDDLGQWRNYAKDATGYCLGIDTSRLGIPLDLPNIRWTRRDSPPTFIQERAPCILKVLYTEADKSLAIRQACDRFKSRMLSGSTTDIEHARVQLAMDATLLSLRLKHESFAAEEEYRIVNEEAMQTTQAGAERLLKRLGGEPPNHLQHSLNGDEHGVAIVELGLGPRHPDSPEEAATVITRRFGLRPRTWKSDSPYCGSSNSISPRPLSEL
jgi:Protein of unknown function (DUF2971)